MRLKISFLALLCLLFTFAASAGEQNLEEKMRQLSVDVPKQQAELDSRLEVAEEEIARLKEQLLAAQEQLMKLESSQSTTGVEDLSKNVESLKREVERLALSSSSSSPSPDSRLVELESEFGNFKKALIRTTAIALPLLLGLGLFF